MNISKSLFKDITRCSNFLSLYNMITLQGYHDVKEINGINLECIKKEINFLDENETDITSIEKKYFDLLSKLKKSETDFLETYNDIFKQVEVLALKYIEKIFNHNVIYSEETYKQKKFSFDHNGNTYFTYLDGYFEGSKRNCIFEVKATSSSKFDKLNCKVKNVTIPVFIKKNNIMELLDKNEFRNKISNENLKTFINKTINSLSDKYSDCGSIVYDLAISRYIYENSFESRGKNIPNTDYYLVVLNSNYIYNGKTEDGKCIFEQAENGEELFLIYKMNEITNKYIPIIEKEILQIEDQLKHLVISNKCFSKGCQFRKNKECIFKNVCFHDIDKIGSIFDYSNRNYAFKDQGTNKSVDVYSLLNKSIYTMKDARTYLTKPNNIQEFKCFDKKEEYINIDRIKTLLSDIKYPVYYLDFEAYNCPLPRFFDERPYSQSVFQYSLLIQKNKDSRKDQLIHNEFLATDHLDHRKELIVKLLNEIDLSSGGSVVVYNKDFEINRLKEFSVLFPEYKESIQIVIDHVFDLIDVLNPSKSFLINNNIDNDESKPTFNFYDYRMQGSFSIKKVLPLLSNLKYDDLEIKNGIEANTIYGSFCLLTKEEIVKKAIELKKYCYQDTLAMYLIKQALEQKIKEQEN